MFHIPDESNEEAIHIASDDIFPSNDLKYSFPTQPFDEPQSQEVVSVSSPPRGSTFKCKKMNLSANVKYLQKNATILNPLKTPLASLILV